MSIEQYNALVAEAEGMFASFLDNAKQGVPGVKKNQTFAVEARKLSNELTRKLKDFRVLSGLINKPTPRAPKAAAPAAPPTASCGGSVPTV